MMKRRCLLITTMFLLCIFMSAPGAAPQEKPLDNVEIIKLTKLDMGDSVIIAKIKSATAVKFDTSTDDLVKLKEAGVSKAVITAMLERLSVPGGSPPAPGASTTDPKVTLVTADGSLELKAIYGIPKTQTGMFSMTQWVQFNDRSAKIRTRDRKPAILLTWDKDPRGAWWFVQTTQYRDGDDQYRYFDLEGGGVFSQVWSGAPEKGSVVKCEATQEPSGLWRLTPLKQLKPGEYGLFSGQLREAGVLFDFGIDK